MNCQGMSEDTDWFGIAVEAEKRMKCFCLAMQMDTKSGLRH